MGDIQPPRFLTGTGQIRPGVSRVAQARKPAVAHDWTITVPAGVLWKVNTIQSTLSVAAGSTAVATEIQYTVNGLGVGRFQAPQSITTDVIYNVTFAIWQQVYQTTVDPDLLTGWIPDIFLPAGATIASVTPSIGAADQYSSINLYIDEYYFTDEQLTELEIRKQVAERMYIEQLEQTLAQQGGGV